jgi:hypothetical protein
MQRSGKMKVAIIAGLFTKGDMYINTCQAGLRFNEYFYSKY